MSKKVDIRGVSVKVFNSFLGQLEDSFPALSTEQKIGTCAVRLGPKSVLAVMQRASSPRLRPPASNLCAPHRTHHAPSSLPPPRARSCGLWQRRLGNGSRWGLCHSPMGSWTYCASAICSEQTLAKRRQSDWQEMSCIHHNVRPSR